MTEAYLQIMIESLEKKIKALDDIISIDNRQMTLASAKEIDMKAIDEAMDEKGACIDELNKLDDGFVSTFELVKEDLLSEKHKYAEQIRTMQALINEAVEKSVSVNVLEKRLKNAIDMVFARQRKEIKQIRVTNAAASSYYKAMSRINNVDPQLMDKKN